MDDESRRLRLVDQGRLDEATREDPDGIGGAAAVVCKTSTAGGYPTSAASFYVVIPQSINGAETEGSAGGVNADSGTFFALNLGSTIPPVGSTIIVTYVGHRWVFRWDA